MIFNAFARLKLSTKIIIVVTLIIFLIVGSIAGTITAVAKHYQDELTEIFLGKIKDMRAGELSSETGTMEADIRKAAENVSGRLIMLLLVIGSLGVLISAAVLYLVLSLIVVRPISSVISEINDWVTKTALSSDLLKMSNQQIAEGTTEQASSLEEISSGLQEMSAMTSQNTENTKEADSLSHDAQDAARQGGEAMKRMDAAMSEIQQSSDNTARIIKTIDDIAFQTNLLALNAAVEAARAGEAGRGFAVVAEEVRTLARRSADAAKDTSALIEESQKNTEQGVKVAEEVQEDLGSIEEKISKVARLVADVTAASLEQASGIEEVNTAITQVSQITQENAGMADGSADASQELSNQAKKLQEATEHLKTVLWGRKGPARSQFVPRDRTTGYSGEYRGPYSRPTEVTEVSKEETDRFNLEDLAQAEGAEENAGRPEQVIPLEDDDREY